MTFYRVMDDEVVSANSPTELVQYLQHTSMSPVPTASAFRERAAMWVKEMNRVEVRTDNDDNFVADMLEHGFWTIETSN